MEWYMSRLITCLAALLLTITSLPGHAHLDPQIAGYIAVPGGQIWYRLNGREHLADKPAIIVLHGGPGGTHRGNMPLVALADEYPVILYDQLDTGNSPRTDDPANWTVARFVSEIDAIRSALDLTAVVVIGHSWGGTVAAEYAVSQPAGLRAVVLSSPLISTPQWIADNQQWIKQLPENIQAAIERHEAAGTTNHPEYRAAEKLFYSRHMCRQDPCPGSDYSAQGPERNVSVYEYMWGPTEFYAPGTLQEYDISGQLSQIRVPTLMVCGEFDEAKPESCARFAALIEGARNHVIKGAGHSTLRESEQEYLELVRDFLHDNNI
jgi:proline iminopeptidase